MYCLTTLPLPIDYYVDLVVSRILNISEAVLEVKVGEFSST